MKIQKIVLPMFLFLALGCGDIDGLVSKKQTSNYKPDVLEKARKERCASSAQLVEDSSATMGSFQNMVAKSTVFGFSTGGKEDCALTDNISKTFPQTGGGVMSFDILPHSRCVQNDSLWQVVSAEIRGSQQYYVLHSYDSDNTPNIDMTGSVGLSATIPRDLAHLKVLVCK